MSNVETRRFFQWARATCWEPGALDLRHAARALRRSPAFSAVVVLTLAIGIGAATTMYGVMRRLLVQAPPHILAPHRLAKLYFRIEPLGDSAWTYDASSYPFYEQLRERASSLASVAAYSRDQRLAVGSGADAELARTTMVSAGYWRTLGVTPTLGRFIADDEAHPATGARVVVLGHAFWKRRFLGDTNVVGRTLTVKGQPYRIIGVAPPGFRGVELAHTDLWLPLFARGDGANRPPTWHTFGLSSNLRIVVRLRDGVTRARAQADLSRRYSTFMSEGTRAVPSGAAGLPRSHVRLGDITGALGSDMTRIPEATISIWLVGMGGVLLAIACANVAGLLLLRALRRRREIAVRVALGMSRRQLVALLFVESTLLTVVGGAVSALAIVGGETWVQRVLLAEIATEPSRLDWHMLGVAVACTVGTSLVVGLVPALQGWTGAAVGLRDGDQGGSAGRSILHRGLLIAQIALSAVLLVGAGLFLRSLQRIWSLDLGLDPRNVLTVEVDFTGTGRTGRELVAFFERALDRIRTLPGVQSASLATNAPLRASTGLLFRLPGSHDWARPEQGTPMVNVVSDGFFKSTGMRIVRGRDFTASERAGAPVIIVNEALAAVAWPGRSPLGECVYLSSAPDRCTTVVGVAGNARSFRLLEEQRLWFYVPLRPDDLDSRVLLVRVAPGKVHGMVGTLRRSLQELEPGLPYVDVRILADALDPQMRPWRLGAAIFTAFGVIAALLAALGLYGAVAYSVTQRTREIGVRMAVGAAGADVLRLIVGDGLRIAAAGVGAGLVMALAGGRWIRDLLFDTSPHDPAVLALVGGALLGLAVLASLVPARRAAQVNPMVSLQTD